MAQHQQDRFLFVVAHTMLGITLFHLGDCADAQEHLEQTITLYDSQQDRSHSFLYRQDPAVASLSQLAWTLWKLGYPDQALKRSQESLTLAKKLSHLPSLAFALHYAVLTNQFRRESQTAYKQAEELINFAREQGFPFWLTMAMIVQGAERARLEFGNDGIRQIQQGITAFRATGAAIAETYWLALLAEAYGENKQPEEELRVLAEALVVVNTRDERNWEPELYRLKGELTLKSIDERGDSPTAILYSEVEEYFQQSLIIARQQSAKSLELRAAMSLSRLWQRHGKKKGAYELLAPIYGWFTEGFDTADLQDAKALLEELA
ncbi:MAG: tetratricopeptide repeat protein [Candidatus Binatia bacterium]